MKPENYEQLRQRMIKQSDKKWSMKTLSNARFEKELFMEPDVAQAFFNNIITRAKNFQSHDKLSESRAFIDSIILAEFVKADLGYYGVISKKDNTGPAMMVALLFPDIIAENNLFSERLDNIKKNNYQSNLNFLMQHLPYQKRMWSHYFQEDFNNNFFYHLMKKITEKKKEVVEEMLKYGYTYEEVHTVLALEMKNHESQALNGYLENTLAHKPSMIKRKI